MNRSDAPSDLKSQHENCKEVARALLKAMGVLTPDDDWKRQYRARQISAMRQAIFNGWEGHVEAPSDPFARAATQLGVRYVYHGGDPKALETLRERAGLYPAYGDALQFVRLKLQEMGADVPDRLQAWELENEGEKKKRWRWERAKQYRVGMVVQVLVNRNTILLRYGSDEREREQLQWDSQAEHAAPEKEHSGEKVLDRLNRTRARRRGNPVERKILTGRDSVELTSQPSPGQVGIEAIVPETEVNMGGFPDLPATSNDTKRGDGRAYSICDAVAEVLAEARQRGSDYKTVQRAWGAFRNSP